MIQKKACFRGVNKLSLVAPKLPIFLPLTFVSHRCPCMWPVLVEGLFRFCQRTNDISSDSPNSSKQYLFNNVLTLYLLPT